MQIDGHHAVTYVAARIAGFIHADAEKIAYAAQYVDDATNSGAIQFENSKYMYARIASAHRMIDYNNLVEVENHLAWLPFHFLPGNSGFPPDLEPEEGEIEKLVCRPDSHVAREMLRVAIRDRGTKRELHRLGIAMHVYADTFAHQGFVGALSKANIAKAVTSGNSKLDDDIRSTTKRELLQKIGGELKSVWQMVVHSLKLMLVEHKSPIQFWKDFLKNDPLGHAATDTFPDQPFLAWQYENWKKDIVKRDNPDTFMTAMEMMVKAMRAWKAGDDAMQLEKHQGMNAADAQVAGSLFRNLRTPIGEIRHEKWLEAIAAGKFSFGAENLRYVDKGQGSWKEAALGTVKATDSGLELYQYCPSFLESDWKLFHDALQAHRSDVVHDILPKYGICAA